MNSETGNWREMCESLGAFWQDAGVDRAFADDPRDWLAEADTKQAESDAPASAKPFVPPPPKPLGPAATVPDAVNLAADGLPATLADFVPWWLSEPSLDGGTTSQRVPPRGEAGSPLMVLIAEPEAQDRETLLSGPDGALFDAIERALGLPPGGAYRAAALPRHTPAADWVGIAGTGMGAVLRHHIALAAPERLLVLSREALTLLAPEKFGNDGTGHILVGDRQIPLIAAYPLAQMRVRTGYKKIFWKRWLAFANPA